MPEVKGLGEPCDGERHARFDEGRLETVLPRQPSTLLMRNLLDATPKSLHEDVYKRVRAIRERQIVHT